MTQVVHSTRPHRARALFVGTMTALLAACSLGALAHAEDASIKEAVFDAQSTFFAAIVKVANDGEKWTRQKSNLLEAPGKGVDDQAKGQHGDVVVSGDRAWLIYFTHPERKGESADTYATRRSSIQVVELQEQGGTLAADRDAPTRVSLR